MIHKYTSKIFNPSEEHDVHEVLRYILSLLQDDINLINDNKP